jgi:ATP-dependent DNA ligase
MTAIPEFPTLYGESSHGKQKMWSVSVHVVSGPVAETHGEIVTTHGYVDGKKVESRRVVTEGKNIGKKNATTPLTQAISEAQALWNKKKDAGYSATPAVAGGAVVAVVAVGGAGAPSAAETDTRPPVISPMLAHDYNKRGKSIPFPCFVQRKLDGVRCVAIPGRGLFSRNGKQFPHLEHIRKDVDRLYAADAADAADATRIILDGELYSDELTFQEIVGIVKKETLRPGDEETMKKIYLYVYDCVLLNNLDAPYTQRLDELKSLFGAMRFDALRLLPTSDCVSEDDMKRLHGMYTAEGYEGIMLRKRDGVYKAGYRSPELQKYKEFADAEYPIIGFKQGDGEEKGCVIWQCRTPTGLEFAVRPRGTRADRTELFANGGAYIGKLLTVRYQELTTDGVPRFPVGISFRDYE